MSERYDAVVIGGGHNGLVAASYLAREGLKCLLVEKRPFLGGACVTEELWPGFRINRLAYAYSLFQEKIVNDLQLKRWGLELNVYDPCSFVPFPDGKSLFIWNDPTRTSKEIERFSQRDARAYIEYTKFWDGVGEVFELAMLSPPPPLNELVELFQDPEAQEVLRRVMFFSAKDLLNEYFESEYVKAALATQGILGTMAGPMTPSTAYVLGHYTIGNVEGQRGAWAHVRGGVGRLADALAKAARSYGVQISTDIGVSSIVIRDGRACGIDLDDGRRIEARAVVSSADPKQTLLKLAGRDHLDKGFARRLEVLKDEGCIVKVNAAVKELPDYSCYPGKSPGPQHRGSTDIAPSIDYLERAYDDAKYGSMSKEPFLEVVFHSATDPSMSPPGSHTMSILAQYFPYTLRAGTWDEFRQEAGHRVLETLARYAPNIRDAIVHMEVLTPLDMERIFSLPKGNVSHVEITPDQMFSLRPLPGWANYRTPIGGLYLCGSGTHPGGGILGAPGHNASKIVLQDLKSVSK